MRKALCNYFPEPVLALRMIALNEMVEELSASPSLMLPLQSAAYTCGVITERDGGSWHLPPT